MTASGTDKAEQLLNQLHDGIAQLTSSDAWTAWLDVARNFHTYSASNTILLHTGQATANMARPAPPIAGADLSAPGRCRPK